MATIQESDTPTNAAGEATANAAVDATTTTPSIGTADQNATATDEVEELKNPQACFMGLPAELRVRIYGFLFSGDWAKEENNGDAGESAGQPSAAEVGAATPMGSEVATTDQEMDENEKSVEDESGQDEALHASELQHLCSMASTASDDDEYKVRQLPLVCPCFGPTFPAILRANKLTYDEAISVFYGTLEVRSCLPAGNDEDRSSEVLNGLLETLPKSGLKYVSKILLCQVVSDLGATIEPCDPPDMGNFAPMWDGLRIEMAGIKHVRIVLEMNWEIQFRRFEFLQFAGVARLSNVRTVRVQLCYTGRDGVPGEDLIHDGGNVEDFENKMVNTIEEEAEKQGKRIDVSVERLEPPPADPGRILYGYEANNERMRR